MVLLQDCRRGCSSPCVRHLDIPQSHAWKVRHQSYGILPRFGASPPFSKHQIILLSDRGRWGSQRFAVQRGSTFLRSQCSTVPSQTKPHYVSIFHPNINASLRQHGSLSQFWHLNERTRPKLCDHRPLNFYTGHAHNLLILSFTFYECISNYLELTVSYYWDYL